MSVQPVGDDIVVEDHQTQPPEQSSATGSYYGGGGGYSYTNNSDNMSLDSVQIHESFEPLRSGDSHDEDDQDRRIIRHSHSRQHHPRHLKKHHGRKSSDPASLSLATKETRAVNSLKYVMVFVLTAACVLIASGVHHFVSKSEKDKFEIHFHDGAQKILGAIGRNIDHTFDGIDSLIVSMVSFAHATNQSWPFVTIPDFAIRTAKTRSLSNLIYINHLPLVSMSPSSSEESSNSSSSQRLEWEKYSIEHGDWVNESMKIQETDPNYYGPIIYNFSLYGTVHGDFDDVPYNDTSRKYMLPTWQTGPVVPQEYYPPFNYDYLSVTNPQSLYAALRSSRTVITEAYGLPDEYVLFFSI